MGAASKIRIGLLTSSRADFGIYLPLLRAFNKDKGFETHIIAFGTHLSKFHGYTLDQIREHGFKVKYRVDSMLTNDDPGSIATAFALTTLKFADFWNSNLGEFDRILCLGDRYEMAAAVAAGIPFGVKFAHIHGGETTLGAIDNIYRHWISLASSIHFVSMAVYKRRIKDLTGEDKNCHVTGALSLENLNGLRYLSRVEFRNKWGVDLAGSTVLVTIHPETVAYQKNEESAREAVLALERISDDAQLVITMPNADTFGMVWRKKFEKLKTRRPGATHLIENLGTQSYFTCMKHADFLIGNSSSGIIEAASFKKYVINLGDRQKGRVFGGNVIHAPFNHKKILEKVREVKSLPPFKGANIYFKKGTVARVIGVLKRSGR